MKYVSANGGETPNKGEVEVQGVTEQGHKLNVVFQDAEVGMPILSVGELTDTQHKVDFEHDGGEIIHKPTQTITPFIRRAGVYFVKLLVPRDAVQKQQDEDAMQVDADRPSSFGRRGAP